jgi:glyoxylase-like metal-dependent hydrolase (beta-lactamase superfamily II)
MAEGIQALKIGDFECTVLSDGTHPGTPAPYKSPLGFLFQDAPEKELQTALRAHHEVLKEINDWIIPYAGLLIKTPDRLVLMDTGADGLGPDTGKLPGNLLSLGVRPDDIDVVIITHAHRDHLGGITDGKGNLVYKNARYIIWKTEWDFWLSGEARVFCVRQGREAALEWALKNLNPLKNKVELIDRDKEVLPGITAIGAPGHTPGHMVLSLSSKGQQLLCLADTAHHVIHLEHPEWALGIDYDRGQVLETRRKLLGKAAQEKLLVLLPHLPFPGLGHVISKGNAWGWEPVNL